MLYDPSRHEPLQSLEWDEGVAAAAIQHIVRDTEARFTPAAHWPLHPLDVEGGETAPLFNVYLGAAGTVWALHHLQAIGAVALERSYADYVETLLPRNRAWLKAEGCADVDTASYLMGDTGILLLSYALARSDATAARLEALIVGNLDNPARELMWGSPGTLLASLFLHQHTAEPRWAALYARTARKLWSQLLWSPEHRCHYWTQDLYGRHYTFLDAVHGFVATALPLIHGRHLLEPGEWQAWQDCIVETVRNTAQREGRQANWPAMLYSARAQSLLLQFCHGAPGFVICLADLPSYELDDLLLGGGDVTWQAGPLTKGSNLCHGTGGNGYAFLKLFERTGDEQWLARARAFAMHGIAQTEAHARHYGHLRYSLWTGDPGFAIYLHDCIRGKASFPTLDTFFP
jgi:hypothetical protein